ncbi:Uncharacterized protein BM_BM10841 [Brugia malayi]|uniref:Bm10841, isoform b n=1 Tax=Brugia malayi TaxID=6279 RepID=A0A0K0IPP9_BRUMA|nr:Uncharacterized protein BM_BM10841 [Brugia malayi]CDP99995.2 Bm10841, isoform b [Brugia malayi]VIO91580.1 Uncharacterized protein BM_BM10841 [Brugia malayi]
MDSPIDIQTGNEYADEELGLLKTQPVIQNYEQLKASKVAQPSLLGSTAVCKEMDETNVTDELVTGYNCPQAVDRANNSKNTSRLRIKPPADVSQIKVEKSQASKNSRPNLCSSRSIQNFSRNKRDSLLTRDMTQPQLTRGHCNELIPQHCAEEAEYYHPTCSNQNFYFSVPSSLSQHCSDYCQHCSDVYENMRNDLYCGGMCKINDKSGRIGKTHRNGPAKDEEDEATQISHSSCQKTARCSKSIHQRLRPERNFSKSNAYTYPKCICKGICEQWNQKRHRIKPSTVNVLERKHHASSKMLSAPNHHHKSGCRRTVHIIAGPKQYDRSKRYVLKCRSCERHIFHKYCNGRNSDVRHYSIYHPYNNSRNHSSYLRHIYYYKHH